MEQITFCFTKKELRAPRKRTAEIKGAITYSVEEALYQLRHGKTSQTIKLVFTTERVIPDGRKKRIQNIRL